ncbi:MAG TPA: hypothetical protein EYG89_01000, partial [Bacteroidia bacterium]|nr:hypothetical protein [Bacteroidia bacterium]
MKKIMYVIKRSGKKEPLDISKFRKQIKFAVKTTSIDLEEFEKHIHLNLVDNIKTSDLQNLLIQTAEKQCSVE